MGRTRWGKTAIGVLLTVAVTGTAGCGGNTDAKPKQSPSVSASATPGLSVAEQWSETMTWWANHSIDCLDGSYVGSDTAGCSHRVQDYIDDVHEVREAMNTDPDAPKGFYVGAYTIIDEMDAYTNLASGVDDTTGWLAARPLIWIQHEKLNEWITAHPLQCKTWPRC